MVVPGGKAVFDSTSLSFFEWIKVVAAGLLVFVVAEFEKFDVRHPRLAS